jgi:hypothetical protein
MMSIPDDFYLDKEEPNRSCLLALRSIILEQDRDVTETIKYGMHKGHYTFKGFLAVSDNPTLKIKKAEIVFKK